MSTSVRSLPIMNRLEFLSTLIRALDPDEVFLFRQEQATPISAPLDEVRFDPSDPHVWTLAYHLPSVARGVITRRLEPWSPTFRAWRPRAMPSSPVARLAEGPLPVS